MSTICRRSFLALGALSPVAAMKAAPAASLSQDRRVEFVGDGIHLSAIEYARLLARLCEEKKVKQDSYSLAGSVEELEKQFAAVLGKERAVFMPTGTLANHIAVRALAGDRRKVLVQRESHLYNDEGVCAQTLSGLNLVPLAPDRATFTLQEVEEQVRIAETGRVAAPVGAISIESPVRRKSGEVFDYAEMRKITEFAARNQIRTHLDGARLFIASAYTGISPAQYSSLFDTVYVSLYKYFNAGSGAILAGPRNLLENMFHTRRMFGGGLNQVWPYAAVALHYLSGFEERFKRAVGVSEDMLRALQGHPRFRVERVPAGTNIVGLRIQTNDIQAVQKKLAAAGVVIRASGTDSGKVMLTINETLNRRSGEELARSFIEAAG